MTQGYFGGWSESSFLGKSNFGAKKLRFVFENIIEFCCCCCEGRAKIDQLF